MSKIASILSSQIGNLSKKELEKLVLKAASKDKSFHDYLVVNYFDKTDGEQELYEQAREDLEKLFRKNYKGYAEEQRLAGMLGACAKRITEFSKNCKNKNLEADLLMQVLEIPFSISSNSFTTCFTAYNYKVVSILKRVITLIETKMHEDYKIQYQSKINEYLIILHQTSSHLDYVYSLPKNI